MAHSHKMTSYVEEMGIFHNPFAPKDPQCNGLAENFVKGLCKMVRTSVIEGRDPKMDL